jgi:hypothetical protein
MEFVLLHLPHLLPALFGFGFLLRFGIYAAKLPPAHLSDEQLAEWHREQAARRRPPRRVSRRVSRLAAAALPLLVVGFATGLAIYTFDLRGEPSSPGLIWTHTITSLAGLGIVTLKLFRLPSGALRRGTDPRRAAREGSSLVLALLGVPLALTGVALLVQPSTGSFAAYLHLVTSVWWTLLVQWHLYRYLVRALRAAFGGRSATATPGVQP